MPTRIIRTMKKMIMMTVMITITTVMTSIYIVIIRTPPSSSFSKSIS